MPIGMTSARNCAPATPATPATPEVFQGVRSWLLLAGFVLVCAAATS